MDKKSKTLISNITIFAVGNVLVKLISLFLMPLYTAHMSTEQYGVAELLNNLIEIVLPVVTLCIVDAVYRYSIDDDSDCEALFTNAVKILIRGYAVVIAGSLIIYIASGYTYVLYFAAN